ncbi:MULTISPECIES: hypothetical protein [Bacillus cereus group]|uniref:hypothetical protein n=1 Tax=Bacillus cereus group TaxID=86661 RepID=UPI0001A1D9D9|nr:MULTISPECIES: hypothetical protein [Bacillus cereus group]EEM73503.1 hypothetical protein bthur0009_3950 [Bacillus thuringiensis serovar andalousiensis BGSC 4AW1]MEB9630921.1 hypothetical protein [Bacillus anthracis]OUA94508.1 hypothetical protein BK714_24625 [Bacillus thuringiensis serovar oswaldocruzi]
MKTNQNKRGRKPKVYSQELIKELIYRFTQERKITGLIKYMDVYRFSLELYRKGDIEIKFSEDFWRKEGRQGRIAIDSANQVYEYTSNINHKENEKIIDTEQVVEKFYTGNSKNKEILKRALKVNESKLKVCLETNRKLEIKIKDKEYKMQELKRKITTLNNKLETFENIMFMWLDASVDPDVDLINLITTGKSRNGIVDYMFQTIFSENPHEGYEKFSSFRKGKNKDQKAQGVGEKVAVLPLNYKNSLLEDFNL